MEKRKVERLLKAGLGYAHIADQLQVSPLVVSAFVREHLPELARTKGRTPHVIADAAFGRQLAKHGPAKMAEILGVSVSAVHRARVKL